MNQILTTKLNIPNTNTNLVPRPRLYKLVDEGLRRKLLLVSAPAGFGKSTLVTDWLSRNDQPAAWISLDQGDNDPVRFWTYFIAAIQSVLPKVGVEAHQIVSTPQLRSTEPVAISLLNDIVELDHDLIIVLDDYHVIEAEQIHEGLSFLFEHQPPNFHMVLITRVDPSISLARLRAHSQLAEIRAGDLQFSIKEADALLNEKMGLNLKPEHIEALNNHTENWVVGLQLAALSLKGHPSYDTFIKEFTGGHKFILDYLIEEVLVALPDAQRRFLLHTSILERLCGDLCQAVTGNPSSQQMLDEIKASNLFLIPLDDDSRWFRYHHLFSDVLLAVLEQDHPQAIETLHLKAAEWFESKGYPNEAVDHALHSGDKEWAKKLILKHSAPFLYRGEIATVLRWLDSLPNEMQAHDPILALAHCWALFLSGQSLAIEPHLEQASSAYERLVEESSLVDEEKDSAAAQLAMMQSVLARIKGDNIISVAHAEEATQFIPKKMLDGIGTSWNMLAAARAGAGDFDGAIEAYEHGIALSYKEGNLVGAYGCIYGQAMYMIIQGRLNEGEEICRSTINRAMREGHGDFPAMGSLYIALARINLERNNLDEAETNLNTGLQIARSGGYGEAARTGRHLLGHLTAARGDLKTATEIFQDTERIVNAMHDPYLTGELNWEWGRLCVKVNDLDSAYEKFDILDEKCKTTQHANLLLWRGLLLPHILSAEGKYDEALTELEKSLNRAREANSKGVLVRLLALQAVVLNASGDFKPARSALQEAVTLGKFEGYIWFWLSAGPEIWPMLRNLRDDRDTPKEWYSYLDALLIACKATFKKSALPKSNTLHDPLTSRELEILRLISKGRSNPQIASELFVTINTIKKHTSHIYSKLGVRSRTQAIARAHELNLL